MRREIPLSVPYLDPAIVENLKECVESGWVSTGGRFIPEFEKKLAAYVGTSDAVGVQSGTAGLHLALKILGVGADDEVIVPTLTFIAAVNPIAYLGAHPVFMDCNEYFCIDCDKLESFLREECATVGTQLWNVHTGRRIAAILPVHVFGNLCDMERIMALAEEFGLKVLEDATEALGSCFEAGKYIGRFAGSIGDIGVYSFNANKIITTGGGGMLVSHDQNYLERARYLGVQAKNDTLYFVHDEIGYNYRMLNLQAALGVNQFDQLETFIETKRKNFRLYEQLLEGVPGIRVLPFSAGRTNHWFYSIFIDKEAYGLDRDELMHELLNRGIQCRPVWKLIHTQKSYAGSTAYLIEQALTYANNVLNIPCSSNLSKDDVRYVSEMIANIIQ